MATGVGGLRYDRDSEAPMGELDIAAKALLREEPGALVRLALPGRAIKAIEPDETEFQALERRMDKLLRLELADEAEPVWLHVEVEAVWGADVPRRVHGYWSLAHETRPALRSLVLVLRPGERQGEPRGDYVASFLGRPVLSFEFEVVCAWKLKASELLARREPGLLPLVPFAEGASVERVEEAFNVLAKDRRSGDLQVVLAAFSSQVFPGVPWSAKISKEILMESTLFKELRAEIEVEARRGVVGRQLRAKLGKNKRTDALVAGLPRCTGAALEKIELLLVSSKKKADLLAAIEKLVPKADPKA